jgi:hypothetical protein
MKSVIVIFLITFLMIPMAFSGTDGHGGSQEQIMRYAGIVFKYPDAKPPMGYRRDDDYYKTTFIKSAKSAFKKIKHLKLLNEKDLKSVRFKISSLEKRLDSLVFLSTNDLIDPVTGEKLTAQNDPKLGTVILNPQRLDLLDSHAARQYFWEGLSIHEVLSLLLIEGNGDYHVSVNLVKFLIPIVKGLRCSILVPASNSGLDAKVDVVLSDDGNTANLTIQPNQNLGFLSSSIVKTYTLKRNIDTWTEVRAAVLGLPYISYSYVQDSDSEGKLINGILFYMPPLPALVYTNGTLMQGGFSNWGGFKVECEK